MTLCGVVSESPFGAAARFGANLVPAAGSLDSHPLTILLLERNLSPND